MTPKQKATELTDRFRINVHLIRYGHDNHRQTAALVAALVCVDQIIDTINDMEDPSIFIKGECENNIDYWYEVYKEIEQQITRDIKIIK